MSKESNKMDDETFQNSLNELVSKGILKRVWDEEIQDFRIAFTDEFMNL